MTFLNLNPQLMPSFLYPAFTGEGNTDRRFLSQIITRTFQELLFEAKQQVDSIPPLWLGAAKGEGKIFAAAKTANDYTLELYCIHADADRLTHDETLRQRIIPGIDAYNKARPETLVFIPIIPMRMIEAWMLADTSLLKTLIRTELSDSDLGWTGEPEGKAKPKETIIEGIRISKRAKANKFHGNINSLYGDVGEQIDLQTLGRLPSYQRFRAAARTALVELVYLQS